MRYRIEFTEKRCCNFANSSKELLEQLKELKREQVADIRKLYKNGASDSVLETYAKYL